MLKRIFLATITIFVLVGSTAFASCTPNPPPSPATTKTPSTQPDGPVRGGVYRSAALNDAASFDPYTDIGHRVQVHAAAVFNALVKADPLKEKVSIETIIPDLAEKWEISPDGKTYTFSLRQGVKFHDGKPFTATDVKYSLDRFRDPKTSVCASNVEAIDSIQIVNDYTVKINLKYPYSELLIYLSAPFGSITPAHLKSVDPKSTDYLIGTGPFKFVSRVPGKVSTYERNPDYFIKGLPYLDRYEVYIVNVTAITDQFIGGRLDTNGTLRQLLDDVVRIRRIKQQAPEAIVYMLSNGSTIGLEFNLERKGPWQDVKVRRAMALAFDYEGTITAGVGGPEAGFVAPSGLVPFYMKEALTQKEVMSILGLDKPLEQRVATAKQLLKDAGYPNGFSVTCIVRDSERHFNPTLFASDLWKRYLNIDMKVDVLEASKLFALRDKGEFDMYVGSINVPTGNSIIEPLGLFTSDSILNSGKWSNAEYDKLFDQIIRELDSTKRTAAAKRAQQILLDELPYLIFHGTTSGTAVRPDIRTGWPPVKGIVLQPGQMTLAGMDRIWFANTPDAKRWMDTQK